MFMKSLRESMPSRNLQQVRILAKLDEYWMGAKQIFRWDLNLNRYSRRVAGLLARAHCLRMAGDARWIFFVPAGDACRVRIDAGRA